MRLHNSTCDRYFIYETSSRKEALPELKLESLFPPPLTDGYTIVHPALVVERDEENCSVEKLMVLNVLYTVTVYNTFRTISV